MTSIGIYYKGYINGNISKGIYISVYKSIYQEDRSLVHQTMYKARSQLQAGSWSGGRKERKKKKQERERQKIYTKPNAQGFADAEREQ